VFSTIAAILLVLATPAMSAEEQNSPNAFTKENAAEIAADFNDDLL
jgi:hypothetical protein